LFYIDDIDLCDEVMDGALRGCSFVIHIPLPFCSQSQSNVINTFIEPIVPFSLKFYQCCLREARRQFRNSLQGNVFPSMRIIYIGSAYSVHYENIQTGDTLNEETWNKHSTVAHEPMVLAKTLAEKALWEIYESEEARTVHLEVYSLLFPTILGPVNQSMAHGLDQEVFLSSNISLVRDLLANYYPSCPNLHLNIIDVRDAVSSIAATMFTTSECRRILISNENCRVLDISRLLKDNFEDTNPPSNLMSKNYFMIFKRVCEGNIRTQMRRMSTRQYYYSQDEMVKLPFSPSYALQETVIDTAVSLLEGNIVKTRKLQLQMQRKEKMIYTGASLTTLIVAFFIARWILHKLNLTWTSFMKQAWKNFLKVLFV